MNYSNTNNPIDFPQTVDPIRKAFEEVTYPTLQLAGTYTAHGLRRRQDTGEYVSDTLEDHWQTFQEGWEEAVKYITETKGDWYARYGEKE